MTAARLLGECLREFVGGDEASALGGEIAQHLRRRRRKAGTPQIEPLSRTRRAEIGNGDATVALLDERPIAQFLAPGIEVSATRLQSSEGCRLPPGETGRGMALSSFRAAG